MPYVLVYYHFGRGCWIVPRNGLNRLLRGGMVFWFQGEWTALCSETNLKIIGYGEKLR